MSMDEANHGTQRCPAPRRSRSEAGEIHVVVTEVAHRLVSLRPCSGSGVVGEKLNVLLPELIKGESALRSIREANRTGEINGVQRQCALHHRQIGGVVHDGAHHVHCQSAVFAEQPIEQPPKLSRGDHLAAEGINRGNGQTGIVGEGKGLDVFARSRLIPSAT